MAKRRRVLIALALVLGVVAAGVALVWSPQFQRRYNTPAVELPADGEVAEVRASLREFQGFLPAVPEFAVPADQVPAVLGWLRPAERVRERWPLDRCDEIGEVIIRTKAGDELRLRFYWVGKNPALFTPDGVGQFYGRAQDERGRWVDGGMRLRAAIVTASEATPR